MISPNVFISIVYKLKHFISQKCELPSNILENIILDFSGIIYAFMWLLKKKYRFLSKFCPATPSNPPLLTKEGRKHTAERIFPTSPGSSSPLTGIRVRHCQQSRNWKDKEEHRGLQAPGTPFIFRALSAIGKLFCSSWETLGLKMLVSANTEPGSVDPAFTQPPTQLKLFSLTRKARISPPYVLPVFSIPTNILHSLRIPWIF